MSSQGYEVASLPSPGHLSFVLCTAMHGAHPVTSFMFRPHFMHPAVTQPIGIFHSGVDELHI